METVNELNTIISHPIFKLKLNLHILLLSILFLFILCCCKYKISRKKNNKNGSLILRDLKNRETLKIKKLKPSVHEIWKISDQHLITKTKSWTLKLFHATTFSTILTWRVIVLKHVQDWNKIIKKLFLPFFRQPNVTFCRLSNDYRLALPTKIFCWGGKVSAKWNQHWCADLKFSEFPGLWMPKIMVSIDDNVMWIVPENDALRRRECFREAL